MEWCQGKYFANKIIKIPVMKKIKISLLKWGENFKIKEDKETINIPSQISGTSSAIAEMAIMEKLGCTPKTEISKNCMKEKITAIKIKNNKKYGFIYLSISFSSSSRRFLILEVILAGVFILNFTNKSPLPDLLK